MSKPVLYALRYTRTGELLGFTVRANGPDAEFCNEYSVSLTRGEDEAIWTAKSLEDAIYVRDNSTPWYNSTSKTPANDFVGDCEIVPLHLDASKSRRISDRSANG